MKNKENFLSFGATLSRAFSRFLLVFLASFLLSKYEFGIFNIFLSIYFFSRLFSENSLHLPFIKFATDGENEPAEVNFQIILLKILYVFVVSAIIFIFSDFLAQYSGLERKKLLFFLPLMLFALTMYMFVGQVLIARMQLRLLFVYELLNCLVFILFLTGAYFLTEHFSTENIVIVFSLAMIVSAVVGGILFRRLIDLAVKINKVLLWKIVHYSKFTVLSGASSVLLLKTDVLILGYLRSPQEVGIYGMAMFVNEAVNMVFDSVLRICLPKASILSGDKKRLMLLFQQSVKNIYIGIIPIVAVIAVAAPSMIHLIYKGKYDDSIILIYLFLAASVIKPIGYVAGTILGATGNIRLDNRNCWISALLNLLLNYLLIPDYGVMGAASASIVSFTILTVLHYLSFHKIVIREKKQG
jgi:O-antigen/teichoic acid export membrane protein